MLTIRHREHTVTVTPVPGQANARRLTAQDAATGAAILCGGHPLGRYTLADAAGNVVDYAEPCPTEGEYQLVDTGGMV